MAEWKLIDMTIAEARAAKWLAGREKHGPVFVGDPLEELDGELVDAMNYAEEAEGRGMGLGSLPARLHAMCMEVRQLHRRAQYQQLVDSEAGNVG